MSTDFLVFIAVFVINTVQESSTTALLSYWWLGHGDEHESESLSKLCY